MGSGSFIHNQEKKEKKKNLQNSIQILNENENDRESDLSEQNFELWLEFQKKKRK